MSQEIATGDLLVSEVIIYRADASQLATLRRYHRAEAVVGASIEFKDVAAALSAAWAPSYKDLIYNGASFRGVRVRRVVPVGTDAWGQHTADAGAGLSGPNPLPSQAAGLVTFGSPSLGAAGEGRQFLPFPATLDNGNDGKPTAGWKARALLLGGLIVSTIVVTVGVDTANIKHIGWKPGAFSFVYLDRVLRVGNWATQKSRGAYGRANPLPF